MRKTMASKVIDRLLIVVHGTGAPSDGDWDQHLDLVAQSGVDRTMVLVYTEGGGPTAQQRRRLRRIVGDRVVPAAILSARWSVRAWVNGTSIFGRRQRAFPQTPQGLYEAIAYLDIPRGRYEIIEPLLRLLNHRAEISINS